MLPRGEVGSINEVASQKGVDPFLICRTLRLATLNPAITQSIITGQEPFKLTCQSFIGAVGRATGIRTSSGKVILSYELG